MNSAAAAEDAVETRDTADRLLDAAERLFADHGFNGVSLRTITSEAGVNLAAANYHFGSKAGLFRAVLKRRVDPMGDERLRLLDACIADAADTPPDLAAVLEAFLGPAIRVAASPGAAAFRDLSARAMTDPSPQARAAVYELYDEGAKRFIAVLRLSCPHLSEGDLFWRLAFIYGAMMYVRTDTGRIGGLLGTGGDMSDSEAAMRHLIPFLAAGMRQPSVT